MHFTQIFVPPVTGCVVRLLLPGSPAAVRWLVVAIVIPSIERGSNRPLPQVLQKKLERVRRAITYVPARAHLNPASSVPGEPACLWIAATFSHLFPQFVERVLGQAMYMAALAVAASASQPSRDIGAHGDGKGSAGTLAQPRCRPSWGKAEHLQLAEFLASQITKTWVTVKRVIIAHTVFYTINIEIGKWDKPHITISV